MGDTLVVTRTESLYGRQLGGFILRGILDEGAFGAVYRAYQPLLGRDAVVKVLHQSAEADAASRQRFAREAQLASQLSHPHAAHVYEFGIEDDGLIWIAMELVNGVTLAEWLRDHERMSLEQFAPFLEHVAEAVQAAHERGIVHRDLKPTNVMVVERSGRMTPKLLDFGLAKMLGEAVERPAAPATSDDPEATARVHARCVSAELTSKSRVVGSPFYMAPEQWRGEDVGPAADVYALGVITYEALAGRRPYRDIDIRELGRLHCEAPIPVVGDGLPAGLDYVIRRALAKRPQDRFSSVVELAAALRTEADHQLVAQVRVAAEAWDSHGRGPGRLWRDEALTELERWYHRTGGTANREALTPAEIAFVESSLDAAQRAEERAARFRRRARKLGAVFAGIMALAVFGVVVGYERYEARLAQQRADDAEQIVRATTITAELEQGRAALLREDLAGAQQHLEEAWRLGERSRATRFMLDRAETPLRAELARLPAAHGRMWSASWSPDGRWIVTTDDGSAQIWDGANYGPLGTLRHGDTVYAAAWIGSEKLATACGDGTVRIWDVKRGETIRTLEIDGKRPRWSRLAAAQHHVAAVDASGRTAAAWDAETGHQSVVLDLGGQGWPAVAFSADGRWLAASGGDAARIIDTASWHSKAFGAQVHQLVWDPSGLRLLTGSGSGDLSIWDAHGSRVDRLHEAGGSIDAVAWSPNGERLAAALRDGTELVFDAHSDSAVSVTNQVHGKAIAISFSPDSTRLSVAASSGIVAISDVSTGSQVALFDAARSTAWTTAWSPSGDRAIAAIWTAQLTDDNANGIAWVWSAAAPYQRWHSAALAETCGLVGGAEPDGRYNAVACVGHPTRVWDLAEDRLLAELPALRDGDRVPFPIVSADGTRAAIARGTAAEIYELPGGALFRTIEHGAAVTALAFSPDGELLSGSADGTVLRDGQHLADGPAAVDALAVLPDGRVAIADARATVRVVDRGIAVVGFAMPSRARLLRPSPNGRHLLAVPSYASLAAPPTLIDLEHDTARVIPGPQVYAARWTPLGILTSHADGAARLWSPDGTPVRIYRGGRSFLSDAALTPDGAMVVGAGADGALRWWDAATGALLWAPRSPSPRPLGVAVGNWGIVVRGAGGDMSRWVLP